MVKKLVSALFILVILAGCTYETSSLGLEIEAYNKSVEDTLNLYSKVKSVVFETGSNALQDYLLKGIDTGVLSFSTERFKLSPIEGVEISSKPLFNNLYTFTNKSTVTQRLIYATSSGKLIITVVWDSNGIVSVRRVLDSEVI